MLVVVSYVWFIYRTMELQLHTKRIPSAKTRESVKVRVGFGFTFHCLIKWGEIFLRRKSKRHLVENHSKILINFN